MAALLIATAAWAQSDADAPPRALGHPPAASDRDEPPQDVLDTAPPDDDSDAPPQPRSRGDDDAPPDVDTSDLAEPEEAPPPPASASKKPSAAPPPDTDVVPLPPPPPRASVQVQTLGTIEAPAEGLLDSSNGGLGDNMWVGASHGDIETLLPKLPLASPDSAVRGLAKRLILTKAESPSGTVKRPLITIRLEKLLDAGLIDDAANLAASGSLKDDPDFARAQANAILTAGRAADACGNLTIARESADGQFWLQLRAYCAAATGDAATAEITRNLLDAQLLTDRAYDILVQDALTNAKKPPGAIAKPSTMHLFLLRKAGLPVGADVAKALGVSASLIALRDPHNTPEARLAAAERAAKAGAATAAELKAVVDAQVIAPAKLVTAEADAPKLSFLAGQALLRRAAQLESRLGRKAALVHQALLLGDKAGMFETASRLQADVASAIDPKAASPEQAPLIGWSLLLAGKSDAASRWLGDNDAARAVQGLVSGKEDQAQASLSNVAAHLSADPKQQNQAFEALVLGAYDALGLTMPADAKQAAKAAEAKHWPGRRPDDMAMQVIVQTASAPDRKGEAVLRMLNAIGPGGPRDLAPDVTTEFVRALEDMGLKDAAHALAVHALLLYRP
ncbi:MAG TPA: hypothetical protein VG889_18100 [Rhizomicrobium sp.]|nr:hypothetical protein [Rhizomicrobium sp.]